MAATARETVLAYYEALRTGEPLAPYFAAEADAVKFGISERLVGGDDIAAGLREQTRTTTDWTLDSRALRVTERECHAWFSDLVTMEWTDTAVGRDLAFDTRWSGTLERRDTESDSPVSGAPPSEWRFVGMHVSTAGEL